MTGLPALLHRLGPDPRPDGELLHAFRRDRDPAAFAALVRRHGPTVWGVCCRTLPPADAEDAYQATWLVLLRRGPPAGCVAAWLYRVAVLTSRSLRRQNARRRTVSLPDLPARPEPPPVDLDALLAKLPERERAAVVLCHLHGLTQREAAERLGVPPGTLSARLSRGLARLRARGPLAGLVAVGVPAGVAEAAVTVATAGRAAGPGVGFLVAEVLRMFWLKKLARAGLAVAFVGGFGAGLGVATRPAVVAAPDPPPVADPPTGVERPVPLGKLSYLHDVPASVVDVGRRYELLVGQPFEPHVGDPAVARITPDPADNRIAVIEGLRPGTTRVAWSPNPRTTGGFWLIVVPPPATDEDVILAVGESRLLAPKHRPAVIGRHGPGMATARHDWSHEFIHVHTEQLAPPGSAWVLGLKPGECWLNLQCGGERESTTFKITVKPATKP